MSCQTPIPVIPPAVTDCPAVTGTCPVPDAAVTTSYASPTTVTVAAPTPVDESCGGAGGLTTDASPGGTSTSTTYIPVAGPQGPTGAAGLCGKGFNWASDWETGFPYQTWTDGINCNADTVKHGGSTYVCIQDHISSAATEPGQWFNQDWMNYWDDMASQGAPGPLGIGQKMKGLLDNFFDYVMDMPNWGIGDWVKTIAAVSAAAWVGSKVKDMMDYDGDVSTGAADFRYDGTPGFTGPYTPPTLPQVVARICARAGLSPAQYDVSQLPDTEVVYGATITSSATDALNALKYIYGFDIVKATSQLIFVPYNTPVVLDIPMDDMGFETNKPNLSRYNASRVQASDLPRRVSLTFKNSALNYHEDQEKAELFHYTKGQDSSVSLPYVLTNQQAKDISERALQLAHTQANSVTFTLPYKYMGLQPGDNVNTHLGVFRVLHLEENPNHVINVTAVSVADVEYSLAASGQAPRIPQASTNKQPKIGFTAGIILDLPPLNSSDNQPRVHVAAHGFNDPDWAGCQIYETRDGGQTYDVVGNSGTTQATVGMCDLATAPVPENRYHVWDDVTEITVRVKTNQLLSAPNDLAVYNGANLCMIGSEILAFRDATLVGVDSTGNNIYTLSRLLRGLRGTEWSIPEHVDEELFVMLDDTLIEIPFPLNERGRERTYRFVTVGSDPSLVGDETITPYMINMVPWRVAHPTGSKIASSNDYGFQWTPRPSFDNELQAFRQAKNDPTEWGGWHVQVLNPADLEADAVYTEYVTEPSFTFTEQMQIDAFGSLQSCVYVKIIAMSRKVGGGYSRIICAS